MDTKTALKRRIIGDPVPIPCLGGEVWIKPKKYSIDAADEINAVLYPRRALFRQIRKAAEARKAAGAIEEAEDAEPLDLGDVDPAALAMGAAMRLQLRHGVAEHNFDGQATPATSEWIEEVMQDSELAREIVSIIATFNRPLAKGNSANSGTQSSSASAASASGS